MQFHKDGSQPQNGEVFVFGSNLAGHHGGGSALAAKKQYGAIKGQSEGLQGNSYAIPTKDAQIKDALPLADIQSAVTRFIEFASANPEKQFFVTRIGCVLAGYSDSDIAPMFSGAPANCSFSQEWKRHLLVLTTYKGFNADWSCRDFKYVIGKTYRHDGDVKVCASGFHACEYPLDIFNYYAPAGSKYAIVEQSGQIIKQDDDSKVASKSITLSAEIDIAGLVKAAITYTSSKCLPIDPASPASATGYQSAASATGYKSAASATGNRGAASATGYKSAASATGYQGAASATGDQGSASATGDQGAAMTCGYGGKAMGRAGCALFLCERGADWKIISVWAGIVGKDNIKPDAWYMLKDGEPVEVAA